MLHLIGPQAAGHAQVLAAGPLVAGAGLLATATVAGAWLARRRPGQQQIWFGAAAGALLVIAGMHIIPDAWSAARAAGVWPWAVPGASIAAFLLAGVATRGGCACQRDTRYAGGAGAAALAVHRFLEGSAVALTGSAAVVAALAIHALGEGLAVGALLRSAARRRAAIWLAAICASPVLGVLVTSAYPVPVAASPLALALAGGVLAQAARVSLRAACHGLPPGRFLFSGGVAAAAVAATVTMLAVPAAG